MLFSNRSSKRPFQTLAAALVASVGLFGCSDSSSSGGGGGQTGPGDFVVSQNGAGNSGTVSLTNNAGSVLRTFNTGANEGIVCDAVGNLVQNNDIASNNTVRLFNAFRLRANNSNFAANLDGEIFTSFTGNPKGAHYVASRNILLVAQFNGRTSAGSVVGVSIAARGTSTARSPAVLETASFSGGNIAGINGVTATSPWDIFYDDANDRLFVAVTDGSVAVYDNFFGGGPNGANADRFITPMVNGVNTTNLHGITFLNGTLALSDVGPVTAGANDDGLVFVVPNAATVNGNITVVPLGGSNTGLGNPVDLAGLSTGSIIVAEKTNDFLSIVGSFANFVGGNNSFFTVSNTKPESIAEVKASTDFIDLQDISSPSSINNVLVVSNPGDNTGGTENQIMSFTTGLVSSGGTFTVSLNLAVPGGTPPTRLRSLENIMVDSQGLIYCAFGNDNTTLGATQVGEGGVATLNLAFNANRFASTTSFDASLDNAGLTGAATTLLDPKGIEVTNDIRRGNRIMIAENDATQSSIVVYGGLAGANVAPLFRTTNLGSAGRRPWDLDYDPINDRLFVACTDGTCIVYDSFLTNGEAGGTPPGPNRTITPTYDNGGGVINAINLHGVVYYLETDTLILSDVGSAASGTDGAIVTISGGASANGTQASFLTLVGNNTNLGNPVDIAFDGTNLYIAEKSNNLVMRYNNYLTLNGNLNTAPDSMAAVTAPESVAFRANTAPSR